MIRIGFIGCGGNANGHMRRLASIPEAKIVALSDISKEAIDKTHQKNPQTKGLPSFSDYNDMLNSVEMDAVEISTPHTLHFEQIMASLEKDKHVLVEKPMVCTVEHAKEVIAKSKERGKILMISYQRHFAPHFRYIRNQIQGGELGEIQFVSALQAQNWYRNTQGKWRQKLSLSGGGQLNDSGSHLLDIILWTTGEAVDEVSAYSVNFDSEVDINSTISAKFKNEALANISVVGNSPGGMWEDISFWGEKAVIYLRRGKVYYCCAGSKEIFEPTGLPGVSSPDKNFIESILGRDEVQVPATCGLRVAELTEAIWESAKKGGQPVKVRGN